MPDPQEPAPAPVPIPEDIVTTDDAQDVTVIGKTTKIPKDEMKDPECTKRRQKFVDKYKDLTKITDISKVKIEETVNKKGKKTSKCFYQEKQCNDDFCVCVRKKSGKPRYRKKDKSPIRIPLDEADYQCDCKYSIFQRQTDTSTQ